HGEGHWGIVKWVALHDVQTGIPLRPAWGPMYGPQAISEQQLAREILQRAPQGSVIMGDGNFGIFFFAYEATQSQHPVLFRLAKSRALALAGGKRLGRGERQVVWRPSRLEREKYADLPEEAQIEGRLMVVKEKELLIAVVAYGLVRALMALAARRAGLSPRQLSFTRAYGLVNALVGRLCTTNPEERQKAYDRMLGYIGKAKLPCRRKRRSYPRAVWGRGKSYPKRG